MFLPDPCPKDQSLLSGISMMYLEKALSLLCMVRVRPSDLQLRKTNISGIQSTLMHGPEVAVVPQFLIFGR